MTDTRIEELELSIEEAQRVITLRDKLIKLQKNKDFKEIFEKELLENYATNTVYALSNPNMQDKATQEDLIKELEMIGRFRLFCSSIYQRGNYAEKAIYDNKEAIAEIRREGGID